MTGYIAMARKWHDHDLFDGDEFSRRDAWSWLIANAAWKATKARVKGGAIELIRGELCFSQRFLAGKWGWSKSRVDRFLALLRDEGMIVTRSKIGAKANHPAGQGQSILSICNYDKYQQPTNGKRGNVEPLNGATAGQQRGKEEEREEGKNILPAGKPATGKTSYPENWKPEPFGVGTDAAAIVAAWPDGELAHQLEQFRDHHLARGNKFDSWQAAWGTWVRNSGKFAAPKFKQPTDPRDSSGLVNQILAERGLTKQPAVGG